MPTAYSVYICYILGNSINLVYDSWPLSLQKHRITIVSFQLFRVSCAMVHVLVSWNRVYLYPQDSFSRFYLLWFPC